MPAIGPLTDPRIGTRPERHPGGGAQRGAGAGTGWFRRTTSLPVEVRFGWAVQIVVSAVEALGPQPVDFVPPVPAQAATGTSSSSTASGVPVAGRRTVSVTTSEAATRATVTQNAAW